MSIWPWIFLSTAQADIELKVEKMELNGLLIRSLHCVLPKDQTMAALQIGAANLTNLTDIPKLDPQRCHQYRVGPLRVNFGWPCA